MEIILAYKWIIVILAEVFGWTFTFTMLFSKYVVPNRPIFWLSWALIGLLDYLPSVAISIIDAVERGNFKSWLFEGGFLLDIILAVLFFLSILLGRKYYKKLDLYLMKKGELIRKKYVS